MTTSTTPTPGQKTKALCIATRCTSVEQFIATFHRFCDESSFFVATMTTRPVGLETAFSIQLEGGAPVLRGYCVVLEAWSTPANRFGRPGVRLGVRRLTSESMPVFKQLQTARAAAIGSSELEAPRQSQVFLPVRCRGRMNTVGLRRWEGRSRCLGNCGQRSGRHQCEGPGRVAAAPVLLQRVDRYIPE